MTKPLDWTAAIELQATDWQATAKAAGWTPPVEDGPLERRARDVLETLRRYAEDYHYAVILKALRESHADAEAARHD